MKKLIKQQRKDSIQPRTESLQGILTSRVSLGDGSNNREPTMSIVERWERIKRILEKMEDIKSGKTTDPKYDSNDETSRGLEGILALPKVKKVGLSARDFMQEQLKGLYSHEFLDGLDNDQIYDLFEEKIVLPGLQHIGYRKPPKPTLNGNVIQFPPEAITDPFKPRPGDPDYEEEI